MGWVIGRLRVNAPLSRGGGFKPRIGADLLW